MKLPYKVLLINIGAAILLTAFIMLMYNDGMQISDIGFAFGLICLGLGGLNLLVGFILALIPDQRHIGSSLLISSAVLLLLSGISCGTALTGMRF